MNEGKRLKSSIGRIPLPIKVAAAVVVITGVALGVYSLMFKSSSGETDQVQTVKVVRGDIAPTLTLTGVVGSRSEAGANFKVSGEIKEIYVKVGDKVTKSQKLAKIDDTDIRRQVRIAKANLDSARAKLSQIKAGASSQEIEVQKVQVENALKELNKAKAKLSSLQKDASSTAQEIEAAQDKVDQAESQYKLAVAQLNAKKAGASNQEIKAQEAMVLQAEENYKEASENLKNATLYSPTSGVVIAINGNVGSNAQGNGGSQTSSSQTGGTTSGSSSAASSDFVVIADMNSLEIEASVDQADIPKVKIGQKVSINVDALPDKEFKGEVSSIDPNPVISQDVVTYKILVSIEKIDSRIMLGMTVTIKIDLGKKENVLMVPNLTVRSLNGKKVVSKVINGTPTDVTVEVGVSDDNYTEIVSGLLEGDEIVLSTFSGVGQQTGTSGRTRFPGMGMFGGGRDE